MQRICSSLTFSLLLVLTVASTVFAFSGEVTWDIRPAGAVGACGTSYGDDELVAATSHKLWTSTNSVDDPNCEKRAKVTNPANGKSVEVKIRNKCLHCNTYDIVLTKGAFEKIADLGVGLVKGTWEYI